MIKEEIKITINNSYDVDAWEKALIKKCIEDNPSSTNEEIAALLGISARSLYRRCKIYGLVIGWYKAYDSEAFLNIGKEKRVCQ